MRRLWKKALAAGIAMALTVSTFTGCGLMDGYSSSGQNTTPTMNLDASVMEELDLKQLYSEEQGYNYYGAPFGATVDKVEEALGYSLGTGQSLGDSGMTCYYPEASAKLVDGYAPTTVEFAFTEEKLLRCVTYQFTVRDGVDAATLDKIFDDTYASIAKIYGDDPHHVQSDDEISSSSTMHSETMEWKQNMGDGNITSLQLVKANYGAETQVVIVGVIQYTEEDEAAATSTEADTTEK